MATETVWKQKGNKKGIKRNLCEIYKGQKEIYKGLKRNFQHVITVI